MNRTGIFVVAALIGGGAGVFAAASLRAPEPAPTAEASPRSERRTRATAASSERPDAPGDAQVSNRQAMFDRAYDLLDGLDAEVALTDEQYDRLADVLVTERESAFATMDAGRPGPGKMPRPPAETAAEMTAHREAAEAAARAVLSAGQYAAWERLRAPRAR